MMELLLCRHGMTAGNMKKCYIGATDEPLCQAGIDALRAQKPRWAETVIVTPLCRTKQTAEILFPNVPLRVCTGLREMDFGRFEGKNYAELSDDPAYQKWVDTGCEEACPGGESKAQFSARCCAAFEEQVCLLQRQGCQKAAFVVHGGTIMSVLSHYARPPRGYFEWMTPNGGVWRLESKENPFHLLILESPTGGK